jgi:hypothetical protein
MVITCRKAEGAIILAQGRPASIVAAAASMTFDGDAERLGFVRQIGRLHRLRRFADLELDVVVLKTIGGDRGLEGEIDVLRNVALSLDLAEETQLRRDDSDEIAVSSNSEPPEFPG